jgi:23S rRNA (uridine2552-2'-O)-methyltransferase
MNFNPRDHYFRKAKKENFVARSVFKLEEIDKKFKLFKAGQSVLDLGATPGSWSQYASQKVGAQGRILAIDLNPLEVKLKNVDFYQADIHDFDFEKYFLEQSLEPHFDAVISDMAPKTTGIRMTDQARSFELCEMAFAAAQKYLKKNGFFICKLFHSDDFTQMRELIKKDFHKFEAVKPDSTRKISKEIFLIGLSKK